MLIRVILASHGKMSAGAKDTAEMILGQLPNLYAVSTTREETESILTTTKRLLNSWPQEDFVYILTDVMGGSVNTSMLSLLSEFPGLTIICGMNLSLIINLASLTEAPSSEELEELIAQARSEIINCSDAVKNTDIGKEDDL